MCTRAVGGDVGAAKELAERTEGRVPAAVNVEGKIDYAAGRSAKEQLMKKLGDSTVNFQVATSRSLSCSDGLHRAIGANKPDDFRMADDTP